MQRITNPNPHMDVGVVHHLQKLVPGLGDLQMTNRHRAGEAHRGGRILQAMQINRRIAGAKPILGGLDGVHADQLIVRYQGGANLIARRGLQRGVDRLITHRRWRRGLFGRRNLPIHHPTLTRRPTGAPRNQRHEQENAKMRLFHHRSTS